MDSGTIKMDYLPFIDDESSLGKYGDAIERSIAEELRDKRQKIHPEAQAITPGELRANPIHSLYCETPYDDKRLLEEYQRSVARIDLAKYNVDRDVDTLCVIDSYLRHQELVLQRLLPQSLLNQWAINNDFLNTSSETLQKVISDQETNIQNLNNYRKNVQLQNEPMFSNLADQWKESLVHRLNVE